MGRISQQTRKVSERSYWQLEIGDLKSEVGYWKLDVGHFTRNLEFGILRFGISDFILVHCSLLWYNPARTSGRGAARLAHFNGVEGVGGSNPLAPTFKTTLLKFGMRCFYFNTKTSEFLKNSEVFGKGFFHAQEKTHRSRRPLRITICRRPTTLSRWQAHRLCEDEPR